MLQFIWENLQPEPKRFIDSTFTFQILLHLYERYFIEQKWWPCQQFYIISLNLCQTVINLFIIKNILLIRHRRCIRTCNFVMISSTFSNFCFFLCYRRISTTLSAKRLSCGTGGQWRITLNYQRCSQSSITIHIKNIYTDA